MYIIFKMLIMYICKILIKFGCDQTSVPGNFKAKFMIP